MADSELKLDMACPWCGTLNEPTAQRCRQCYQDLEGPEATATVSAPSLFDMARPTRPCPACGKSNMLSGDRCFDCGEAMNADAPATLAAPGLKAAARARRRRMPALSLALPGGFKAVWLLRLASVLYLFWTAIDTSLWLNQATHRLVPHDPAALRYNTFAIFELVRNALLVGGIWLLTFLQVGRDD